MSRFLTLGAVFGLLGVACGAFGAHALKTTLTPDTMAIYQTAVQYQLLHAVVLVGLGLSRVEGKSWSVVGWLLVAGIVVFSGSLYALALTGIKVLGAITPIGGLCFLSGWATIAVASKGLGKSSAD